MGKRLELKGHLCAEDLQRLYRKARDPVSRNQLQMVWLAAQGKTVDEIAEVTGYCKRRVREILRAYNQEGVAALVDRRHENPGRRATLVTPEQQVELREALQGPAPDGGAWDCAKVARWLEARLGRQVRRQRGWEWMRRLEGRPPHLHPRHQERSSGSDLSSPLP